MRPRLTNGTYNPDHVKAMFKNFSPTTAFGWLRFFVCGGLIGHVVFMVAIHGVYSIDGKYSVAMIAIYSLVDKFLGGIQGHYTADSPPGPKEGNQ